MLKLKYMSMFLYATSATNLIIMIAINVIRATDLFVAQCVVLCSIIIKAATQITRND